MVQIQEMIKNGFLKVSEVDREDLVFLAQTLSKRGIYLVEKARSFNSRCARRFVDEHVQESREKNNHDNPHWMLILRRASRKAIH